MPRDDRRFGEPGSQRERLMVNGLAGNPEVPGGADDASDESLGTADEHVAVGQVGNQIAQRPLVERCPFTAAD
jgi:hypothetical protein